MATWIADGLARLRADIASANASGNVEGLLARYIVGDDSRLDIVWVIDCEEAWLRRSYDPSSLPTVAALGYTEAFRSDSGRLGALDDGMQRAAARDPLLAGPGAALHDPAVLLGLALAAKRFLDEARVRALAGQGPGVDATRCGHAHRPAAGARGSAVWRQDHAARPGP